MHEQSLSIVVPAKNEEGVIGKFLESLRRQTYSMRDVPIIIADAASTDHTRSVVESFRKDLNVKIIDGGMPSVGRNRGAKEVSSSYVVFIDADMVLDDPTLIERTLRLAQQRRLGLVTTNVACRTTNLIFRFVYFLNNCSQRASQCVAQPYATGMFMFFERKTFEKLGGFNEKAVYAEDFLLSRQVPKRKFAVVPGHITTSDRRFRKMGVWKVVRMFLLTAWESARGNDKIFFKPTDYFDN